MHEAKDVTYDAGLENIVTRSNDWRSLPLLQKSLGKFSPKIFAKTLKAMKKLPKQKLKKTVSLKKKKITNKQNFDIEKLKKKLCPIRSNLPGLQRLQNQRKSGGGDTSASIQKP